MYDSDIYSVVKRQLCSVLCVSQDLHLKTEELVEKERGPVIKVGLYFNYAFCRVTFEQFFLTVVIFKWNYGFLTVFNSFYLHLFLIESCSWHYK